MKTIRQAKWCYIICSALFCLAGLIFIISPHLSAVVICYIVGTMTVLYGLSKVFGYISHDLYNLAFQFDLALGIFVTAVGLILLFRAERVVTFLPVVIGFFVMADAVFKLQTAVDAKRFGLASWWLILIGALLCILLSVLLIFDPFGGGSLITVFVGISLLTDGLQNLFNAFYTVKIMKDNETER